MHFLTNSPEETLALGMRFASQLHGGDVVALSGALGTGKTHFVKGVCKGLGYEGLVSSPTFALINEYPGNPTVYHVDLYRLERAAQVQPLGLEELMRSDTVVMIEWPEVAATMLPATAYHVVCDYGPDESSRTFAISEPA